MLITENQLRKVIRRELIESSRNIYTIVDNDPINLLEQKIKEELLNEIKLFKYIINFAKEKINSINELRKRCWQFGLKYGIEISSILALLDLYVYLANIEWAMVFPKDFPELNLITGGAYALIAITAAVENYYKKLEEAPDSNKKAKEELDKINKKFKADKLLKDKDVKKLLDIDEHGNFI